MRGIGSWVTALEELLVKWGSTSWLDIFSVIIWYHLGMPLLPPMRGKGGWAAALEERLVREVRPPCSVSLMHCTIAL